MIAAQLEPFVRMCQAVGTVLALWGAGWLILTPLLRLVDRYRDRVNPEWRAIDARDRANAVLRSEGYR